MRIIPAIDIINGQCVRLTKGDYGSKKVYNTNPVDVAKSFEDNGIQYLHLVDLDGAKAQKIVNYKVLEDIAKATNLSIDFGGGIKSIVDVEIAFSAGAKQITGGSIAVKNPELFEEWIERYGPDKIILGADCIHRKIATHGWMETSDLDVVDFIQHYEKKGVKYVVCTDISKDGMLEGVAENLYKEILKKSKVQLIASGGVSSLQDLYLLDFMGCEAAIIGKAIYENKISLKSLQALC